MAKRIAKKEEKIIGSVVGETKLSIKKLEDIEAVVLPLAVKADHEAINDILKIVKTKQELLLAIEKREPDKESVTEKYKKLAKKK